ncbi:MAG: N-acylneuraminate cytidylyltransferase [Deltaproteobacteria bacterium]|jgi:N-acylneuraminate cytidylyltransferase|nr:N-acylneuraminate cytidylyltransferase [Deltaproteobacteria bacterium]MBW2537039.1 N-acylneuraminate cytidylyltransferase [Deltaproteobacteria bacterium]
MATVAFIPLRGGSKSIPLKNIRPLGGKPLACWAIEAAAEAEAVDAVYAATDSEEIAAILGQHPHPKLHVIGRSPGTATDTASTESALIEFAENHQFDWVFLVQATSPLVTSLDFDAAWRTLERAKADSLLSVVRQKRFIWEPDGPLATPSNYDPRARPRRQDFDGVLVENGALYLTSRRALLDSQCRLSGRIAYHQMSEETYVELDEEHDWRLVEQILAGRARPSTRDEVSRREIRLLVVDVDGVLTDAGMYYGPEGEALKKFSTRDGMGLELVREAGVEVAILSGEASAITRQRADKLSIEHVHLGVKDKLPVLRSLCAKLGVDLSQVAYVGDDVNDLECLGAVGLSVCPADAAPAVASVVDRVLTKRGGAGCVRELCDWLLSSAAS